jgi:hypothetical protein
VTIHTICNLLYGLIQQLLIDGHDQVLLDYFDWITISSEDLNTIEKMIAVLYDSMNRYSPESAALPFLFANLNFLRASLTSPGISTVRVDFVG